jgi:mRNA interferase RelE/StbE
LTARILYKSSVRHDLKNVDARDCKRVLREVGTVLGGDPRAGEPLAGEFRGLFRLRVGDYRVIYTLAGEDVIVLRIRHRSKVYE